jgi:hypothetical protein
LHSFFTHNCWRTNQRTTHRLAQYAAHTQRTKDLEADRAAFLRHEAVDVANERRDRDQMNVRLSRSFVSLGVSRLSKKRGVDYLEIESFL